MQINKVKGTYDVLPNESYRWHALEEKIHDILKLYNIKEMRTPIMEYSEVFHRQTELSDMVTKETYDFDDRGDRRLTLRPEGAVMLKINSTHLKNLKKSFTLVLTLDMKDHKREDIVSSINLVSKRLVLLIQH
jgi:histidyl-tRNA synthetase